MTASVTLVGNVTRDPELRYLTSGAAVCNFGIAVNRRWQKDGEWQEETSFFDCTVWREQADNVAESIGKGDRVVVVGRLVQRSWENEQKEKRSKVEVVVDEMGPSLRWATASTTKNPKSEGGGGGEKVPDDVYDGEF